MTIQNAPRDTFGVFIVPGDTCRVLGYGWAARRDDVGLLVRVTGITAQGNVEHSNEHVGNGRALNPRTLGVLRRDGLTEGYEANTGYGGTP